MHRKVRHPLQELPPTFIDLSRAELRSVQRLGTVVDFPPDRVVCTPSQGDQLGVVITGELLASNGAAVERLRAGDRFGTGSLQTHDGEIFTASNAAVIVFDRRELASVARECPRLYARLTDGCASRSRAQRTPARRAARLGSEERAVLASGS